MGKNHPDLYSCLNEFQKEQADTETAMRELGLGKRKMKRGADRKWVDAQIRVRNVADQYDDIKKKWQN